VNLAPELGTFRNIAPVRLACVDPGLLKGLLLRWVANYDASQQRSASMGHPRQLASKRTGR
jgi:hypothetical protein